MTQEELQAELQAIYESHCAGDLDEAEYAEALAQAQQNYRESYISPSEY